MFLALEGPTPMLTMVTPRPSGAHEVIGRHLEAVPRRSGNQRLGLARRTCPLDHRRRPASIELHDGPSPGQLLERPAHELVDIAVVIGEQDPRLNCAPVGARVVDEPAKRVVDRAASNSARGRGSPCANSQVPSAISSPTFARSGVGKEPRQLGRRSTPPRPSSSPRSKT